MVESTNLLVLAQLSGSLGGSPKVVHNTPVVSFFNFGEREGSRRRRSWTEGWEEDRAARFRILQKTASEAEEP
jgi:hypothetical protein